MAEDPGGTLTCEHDPADCDNCLQGLRIIVQSIDAFAAVKDGPPPVPISLVMHGCHINWQPNDLH